jgi:hypothetical protein
MSKPATNTNCYANGSTYGFRLKFHLPPGYTFEGVRPRRRLRLEGLSGWVYLVKLRQLQRHRFGARTNHVFLGTGFIAYDEAHDCGLRLKQALGLFAAKKRIGLDVTQRVGLAIAPNIKASMDAQNGGQTRDDVHGLDVYAEQPPVTRLTSEFYGELKYSVRDYEAPLQGYYEVQTTLTKKQQLALDLYNLSHFENVPKTRFLTLITVVEVLAKKAKQSLAVRALLKDLKKTVSSSILTADEKEDLRQGLGRIKRESISSACRSFVSKFASEEDVAFFKECYDARSELLHRGETKYPQPNDPSRLDDLVSRPLISSIVTTA